MSKASYPFRQQSTLIFSFFSEGRKGRIEKLVKFERLGENLFSLAFGDRVGSSLEINVHVVTDNGDIVRVIATVIAAVLVFFKEHPQASLVFKGSDQRRTNFYCRVIKHHRNAFGKNYAIFGVIGEHLEAFTPDKTYDYLLVYQKIEAA